MASRGESTDWRKLPEFAGVDLTDSHILSWHLESGVLAIDVDLLLTSEHPRYETPRPAEKVCIRPAIVEFPYCESIHIDGVLIEDALADTVASLGPGVIMGLRRMHDGPFEINGKFGTVLIDAERPILRLRAR